MRSRWAGAILLAAASLGACDNGKQEAAAALEEARLSAATSRNWGAETFAPALYAEAERELATAEKRFAAGRYDMVGFPAQKAVDAARLARAQSAKLPKHSPKAATTPKTAKAKVKK